MVTCDAVSSDREHDQHARQENPFLEKDPVNLTGVFCVGR